MNRLEQKRVKINSLAKVAPKGSHSEIAKRLGISVTYLYQIRAGLNAKKVKLENEELLDNIVDAYTSLLTEIKEEISVALIHSNFNNV